MIKYLLMFLIILSSFLFIHDSTQDSAYIELVYGIIICISSFHIFSNESEPYTLYKIFYFFSLMFFGIAPVAQYNSNVTFWGARNISADEYIHFGLLIIIISFLFSSIYKFALRRKLFFNIIDKFFINPDHAKTFERISIQKRIILICVSLSCFLIVFWSLGYNVSSLLFRGARLTGVSVDNTTWLLIANVIRPMPLIIFSIYCLYNKKDIITNIVLFTIAIVTMFPTSSARFAIAAAYLPAIFVIFPVIKKKNIFMSVYLMALLFIWPVFGLLRSITSFSSIEFQWDNRVFTAGDMDTFQSLVEVIRNDFVTHGSQILGSVFFWVPRAIWPNKPIGSGAFLSEKLGYFFNNISCNYFAEGYINFGYVGMLIFCTLLAILCATLDFKYWHSQTYRNNPTFAIFYYMSLGFLVFILRGDLLSSVSYFIGFSSSIFFVNFILQKRLNSSTNTLC